MNTKKNNKHQAFQLANIFNGDNKLDIKEYLHKIWWRKWVIIPIIFSITLGCIIYALLFIRPIYEVISVVSTESDTQLNPALKSLTPNVNSELDRQRVMRKFVSQEFLDKLAGELNLQADSTIIKEAKSYQNSAKWINFEEALDRASDTYLRGKINVSVAERGNQIQIAVRDTSPHYAFKLVDTMTNLFVENSRENDMRGIRMAKEFSDEQLAFYKNKLDESERKLRDFNERWATNRAKSVSLGEADLKKIENKRSEIIQAIEVRKKNMAVLERQIPKNIIESLSADLTAMEKVESSIVEKTKKFENELETRGLESGLEMQLNSDINLLRQEFIRTKEMEVRDGFPKLSREQHDLMIEYILGNLDLFIFSKYLQALSNVLGRSISSLASTPGISFEQRKLEDEYAQNKSVYQLFLQQSQGTQIDEAMQNSDVFLRYRIVKPPQMPIYAVAGNKKTFVLIGFAASVAVSIVVLFLLEYFDQNIRTEEDVQLYLGLDILGTIPRFTTSFEQYYDKITKLSHDLTSET